MNDTDKETIALAVDLIQGADVMQVYENELWIKVDQGTFNALYNIVYPQHFTEE
jgi:hypothetical protein